MQTRSRASGLQQRSSRSRSSTPTGPDKIPIQSKRQHRSYEDTVGNILLPPDSIDSSSDEDVPLQMMSHLAGSRKSSSHHKPDPAATGRIHDPVEDAEPVPLIPDPLQSDEEDEEVPGNIGHTSKHAERYTFQIHLILRKQTPYFREKGGRKTPQLVPSGDHGKRSETIAQGSQTLEDEHMWLAYTDIVHPEIPCAHLGLKSQSASVQSVLRRSILIVFVSFCFEHAFAYASNENQCADDKRYIRRALVKAAHKLNFDEIESRLTVDDAYARALGVIIQNRIDDWRSKLRNNASCAARTAYGLHKFKDNELEPHLKELLRRGTPNYKYLFAQGENDKPNFSKPFLHPIFAEILHNTFFSSSSQMGQKCLQAFKTESGSGVYELPASLVALAAIAVKSSSSSLTNKMLSGAHRKFSADAYADIYLDNLETLGNLSKEAGTKDSYHPLMAKLFVTAQ
ncbi:hypothetical protein EIP86_007498 [Pleurotus ostreatoroseus]|nr:hypothetical protein EIP86_007498 [Pleurotus ostreatoroseus]